LSSLRAPFNTVRIASGDNIVTDRRRAAILREQFLDALKLDERPVVIDLNGLTALSLGAADELVVTWLDRVRTPRNPVVAVIASYDDEIRGTVDAALKAAHQAAYLVQSSPEHDLEQPVPIGEVTLTQAQTVDTVRRLTRGKNRAVSGRDAAELGVEKTNTAYMRLDELYRRGLLARAGANGSTEFFFPLDTRRLTSAPAAAKDPLPA
jgi:hypothetical protein